MKSCLRSREDFLIGHFSGRGGVSAVSGKYFARAPCGPVAQKYPKIKMLRIRASAVISTCSVSEREFQSQHTKYIQVFS